MLRRIRANDTELSPATLRAQMRTDLSDMHEKIRDSRNARAYSFQENDNMRFLKKLLEIKQGDKANVARADDWKTRQINNSPLIKDRGHVNFSANNSRLEQQNQKLIQILNSARSTKDSNA